ncbi:phosphatidate cytidylyltransferase [Mycoplasmopsis glycophila]|uniref:Phosphatidate cytidylyltransferase n=1 Tax=Mycoplasmopsis glycophila TaxID=171285 RepID=A0A449AUB4_9BACT|nr:phosphatidate cytidylyltransferase [Mycoplasmopsis glycophila]VEU70068.1 Phosphatidate cytidylyltransferase [Mycoplasmopsis glycophila]
MKTDTLPKRDNLWKTRIFPALLLTFLFIVFISIFKLSFSNLIFDYKSLYWTFRFTSLTFFIILISYIFYELNKVFFKNKLIIVFLIVCMLAISLLDVEYFKSTWLLSGNAVLTAFGQVKFLFINVNYSVNFLMFFALPILFLVAKVIEIRKRIIWKKVILMTLYYFVTSFVLIAFIKTFVIFMSHSNGLEYILLFVLVSIGADIGGFFGGKLLGHKLFANKLAPQISPKKTIEGALVGYLFALFLAFAFIFAWNAAFPSDDNLGQIFLGSKNYGAYKLIFMMNLLVSPAFAILGDLYFSFLKRKTGIKDFSNLLKGHGGLLDRIDSISVVFALWFIIFLFL